MFKTAFTMAALVAVSEAKFRLFKKCQNPRVVEDLDKERFEGRWFEGARDQETLESMTGQCNMATYDYDTNHDRFDVKLYSYLPWLTHWSAEENRLIQGKWASNDGYITDADKRNQNGSLKFNYDWSRKGISYKVLGTDYDRYAIVYGCLSLGWIGSKDYLWVLTRDSEMTDTVFNDATEYIRSSGLSYHQSWLKKTDHPDTCDYYDFIDMLQ